MIGIYAPFPARRARRFLYYYEVLCRAVGKIDAGNAIPDRQTVDISLNPKPDDRGQLFLYACDYF